jgi:hypothetical protein
MGRCGSCAPDCAVSGSSGAQSTSLGPAGRHSMPPAFSGDCWTASAIPTPSSGEDVSWWHSRWRSVPRHTAIKRMTFQHCWTSEWRNNLHMQSWRCAGTGANCRANGPAAGACGCSPARGVHQPHSIYCQSSVDSALPVMKSKRAWLSLQHVQCGGH